MTKRAYLVPPTRLTGILLTVGAAIVPATPAIAQLAPERLERLERLEHHERREDTTVEHAAAAPAATTASMTATLDAGALAAALLRRADDHLGTRYVLGGTTPGTGFDCSGFVRYLFGRLGIALPRTSREQVRVGHAVRLARGLPRLAALQAALRPGDLLFFASRGRRIDHVAIYAGDGRVLHATAYGRTVRYEDLDSPRGRWLVRHFVRARRVLGAVAPTDWTAPDLGAAIVGPLETRIAQAAAIRLATTRHATRHASRMTTR